MTDTVIQIMGARHVVWSCPTCGCVSTVPEIVYDEQKNRGGYHHCPNGHQWGWRKERSDIENLRRERNRLQQQIAERDDAIRYEREQREAAENRERRLKKRAAAGVCPCCNRSFQALTRHMKSKHPNFTHGKPTLKVVA